MPTPCSPVTVPPSAMAASRSSSNAAWAATRAASSPGAVISTRVQVPVAGVRDGGDPHAVPGARSRSIRSSIAGTCDRGTQTSSVSTGPEPFQRGVGQPPGVEQRLRLGVVGGLRRPARPPPSRSRRPCRASAVAGSRPAYRPGPAAAPPRPRRCPGASSPRPPAGSAGPAARAPRGSARAGSSAPRPARRRPGRGKAPTTVCGGRQRGPQPQRHLGDHAERALGADEQAHQVVARRRPWWSAVPAGRASP